MRIAFPVSLACGVALVAGCSVSIGAGSPALGRHQVEKEVSDRLTQKVGQRPKAITCPGDLEAKVGTTMRCRLEADDGSKIGLTLTVTSVKGKHVRYNIQVDKKR
jgi:molybdopterin-biosynthesis enzyme MoeA-like protein